MSKKETQWTPPRGIRLLEIPACKLKPYAVQWRADGRRKTKSFATRDGQLAWAKGKASDLKTIGSAALAMDGTAAAEWRRFREMVGHDTQLDDVAECWRLHGTNRDRLTVAKAVEKLTQAKTAEGVSSAALKHYAAVYRRLNTQLGARLVHTITRDDVAAWLAGIEGKPWTVRTHFKRVTALFHWLRINRHIAHSPCDGMRAPRAPSAEVGILTIAQGRTLFAANPDVERETFGRLALEAFAGLRFSSAARIVGDDIRTSDRGIVLPAAKIKTKRRQYIDGLPENLWAWLEWAEADKWKPTTLGEYMHAKARAIAWSVKTAPHNALRHSFCSYHVAQHKDAARTAVILCHSSPKTLYQHYKGNATEADGKAWFEIMPPV